MNTFNNNFFTANTSYTREMAEVKMREKGYTNFQFKSSSFSNGASFYFTLENGQEVRVSDHSLTGVRALSTIQVRFQEVKEINTFVNLEEKAKKAAEWDAKIQEMIKRRNERMGLNN